MPKKSFLTHILLKLIQTIQKMFMNILRKYFMMKIGMCIKKFMKWILKVLGPIGKVMVFKFMENKYASQFYHLII